VNDPSNRIREKDYVIIDTRLKKDKTAKPIWLPQQNFYFAEKPWEYAYYSVF